MNSRVYILLTPVLTLVGLEAIYFNPSLFVWSVLFVNLIVFWSVKMVYGAGFGDKIFWNYLVLPFLFLNSLIGYFILISNKYFLHLLAFILLFFVYYYLRRLYITKKSDTAVNWENISFYSSFLSLFFLFSFINGAKSNLGLPAWLLIIILSAAIMLACYQFFWANGILSKENFLYIFIVVLVSTEMAWTFFFLPFSFNVPGLLLAIMYYMAVGIIRLYLKNALTARKVKFYLSLGFSSIALIVLTARLF